jgi:hypothetical protein
MVDTCRHGGRYGDLAAFNPSIAKLANGSLLVFFRVSSMSMCMGRSTGVWAFPKYAHARRHAHVYTHVDAHLYTHVDAHVYTHVDAHVYTHVDAHVYRHAHTRAMDMPSAMPM